MSKLLNQDIFKEYLERYADNKVNLSDAKTKSFLELMAGQMLMLVPEASAELVRLGMEENKEVPYIAFAAIGATLQKIGENKLKELRGDRNENNNDLRMVACNNKLCQ